MCHYLKFCSYLAAFPCYTVNWILDIGIWKWLFWVSSKIGWIELAVKGCRDIEPETGRLIKLHVKLRRMWEDKPADQDDLGSDDNAGSN